VQLRELTVVKTDGRRVPFDRDKLARSIRVALRKRPFDEERIERIVNGIQRRLEIEAETEVSSRRIGDVVLETLRTWTRWPMSASPASTAISARPRISRPSWATWRPRTDRFFRLTSGAAAPDARDQRQDPEDKSMNGDRFRGIIPALVTPFRPDFEVDEPELIRLATWLAKQPGIKALMTNGHTGEVFSLTLPERNRVTRVVADAVGHLLPVITTVACEGIREAVDVAKQARDAGAQALDIMPPHHWLRFGFRHHQAIEYFAAIGEASGLPLLAHIYPAWTKASYSSALLADLARLPCLAGFKIGTREMSKYAYDVRAIRQANPEVAVLNCHDEYLLASSVQGVDGGLLGFASLIPGLIHEVFEGVRTGDLKRAQAAQAKIDPLKDAVYGGGEPTGEAHARMKTAMAMAGIIKSDLVRPPTEAPNAAERAQIKAALEQAGFEVREAA
jgi:4-hydroxy-tetrahydrodipicolinate synthase